MSESPNLSPPANPDQNWAVSRSQRRVIWDSATTDCAWCGTDVSLDTVHQYVTVSDGRDADMNEYVFCNEGCQREWVALL
jgi:hypothetical protein